MTRREFQDIALLRLKDAEALFKQNQYDGCCYLAGYVIELALKASICKNMHNNDFFDAVKTETARAFKIHNLKELIILAGLSHRYKELDTTNPILAQHWIFITDGIKWSEQLRYQSGFTQAESEKLLEAINHPQNGILKWIKKYW
jgi:HEPN domain